ncbi:hypothetical protein GRS48_12635 [Halorubrum sp. JWXQ-INN 858]|uniref:hypothetical protein n=1 Tax=Halorubrum sp. JWXQ-INN 858 TaxID=2690782 RepID=UPI00135C336C|nr:hypothetical protein [Halorubrum sp. JWXQ-INN 858]MWV65659.1 hypothetical protein [Halorubrum sp. JWXQ-INN 858]
MIVASLDERDGSGNEERVLTRWRNNRVIRRDETGLRVAVVVQVRRREMWIDEARWLVTPGGIRYSLGNVCYRDEWFSDDKMQEKRVKVYADEHLNEIRIERDWRGPPEADYRQLGDLEWRVGSRWRVDESGAEHVR